MTTLGSWIDDEALAQVINDLCPRSAPVTPGGPERYVPEIGLEPGDLHRPEFYGESKFPRFPADEESVPLESIPIPEAGAEDAPAATRSAGMVQRLASLKQRAERSGLIGAESALDPGGTPRAAVPAPPTIEDEFRAPAAPMAERLAGFVDWALTRCRAKHVCLSDARGEPLTSDSVPAGLPIAASLLADAVIRAADAFPLGSVVHCSLGRGEVLSTIAVREANQVFSIAVVAGAPLSSAVSASLARGLLTALRPPSPSP